VSGGGFIPTCDQSMEISDACLPAVGHGRLACEIVEVFVRKNGLLLKLFGPLDVKVYCILFWRALGAVALSEFRY
jgi:hypothetical protein